MDNEKWTTLESQYKEVVALLEQGHSMHEVEEKLGFSFDGWSKHAEDSPLFYQAVEKVIRGYFNRISKTVWKLAMGYEYEEKTITEKTLPNGEVEKTVTTHVRYKHPDLNACIAAMTNITDVLANEMEIASQMEGEKDSSLGPDDRVKLRLKRLSRKAPAIKNNAG